MLSVCNRQGLAVLVLSLALIHPTSWKMEFSEVRPPQSSGPQTLTCWTQGIFLAAMIPLQYRCTTPEAPQGERERSHASCPQHKYTTTESLVRRSRRSWTLHSTATASGDILR